MFEWCVRTKYNHATQVSPLGKILLLTYEARASGAMCITTKQLTDISRECGESYGSALLYARKLGMYCDIHKDILRR